MVWTCSCELNGCMCVRVLMTVFVCVQSDLGEESSAKRGRGCCLKGRTCRLSCSTWNPTRPSGVLAAPMSCKTLYHDFYYNPIHYNKHQHPSSLETIDVPRTAFCFKWIKPWASIRSVFLIGIQSLHCQRIISFLYLGRRYLQFL